MHLGLSGKLAGYADIFACFTMYSTESYFKALAKLKEEVTRYKPPAYLKAPQVNVVLVGQVGSGKSSFINTVNSVFRGHVTRRAIAGSSDQSLTTTVIKLLLF